MRIVLLMGSYRQMSNGRRVMHLLSHLFQSADAHVDAFDAGALNLPHLQETYGQMTTPPEALVAMKGALDACDGVVLISGEYNHLPQPGLLNMLNFFYEEYRGKVAGLVTYSIGMYGGMRSEGALRIITAALNLVTLPAMLSIPYVAKGLTDTGGAQDAKIEDNARAFCLNMLDMIK